MQEEKKYLEDLLVRYRLGKISNQEKELISQWLFQLDLNDINLSEEEIRIFSEQSLRGLRNNIQPIQTNKRINFLGRFQAIAAGTLLLLTFSAWFYYSKHFKNHNTDSEISLTEISTVSGEHKIIRLSDSTHVILNSQSTLRFPQEFTEENRQVFLEGEASFDVTKNPDKPFLIHADRFDVEVLGTSFNVNAYTEDDLNTVAVKTGKVSVSNPQNKLLLTAGETVSIDKIKGNLNKSTINTDHISAWKEDKLIFENESLALISRTLERRFDIEIEFKNPELKSKLLNLQIKKQSLSNILEAMQLSAGFEYKREGRKIMIW